MVHHAKPNTSVVVISKALYNQLKLFLSPTVQEDDGHSGRAATIPGGEEAAGYPSAVHPAPYVGDAPVLLLSGCGPHQSRRVHPCLGSEDILWIWNSSGACFKYMHCSCPIMGKQVVVSFCGKGGGWTGGPILVCQKWARVARIDLPACEGDANFLLSRYSIHCVTWVSTRPLETAWPKYSVHYVTWVSTRPLETAWPKYSVHYVTWSVHARPP